MWLGLGLALPAWFNPILEVLLCNVERYSHFWMISCMIALLLSSPGSGKKQ